MSEKVIGKAKELAQVIAESPEFIAMRMAEDASAQDEVLTQMFAEYAEKRAKIEEISAQESPDFDEMGRVSKEFSAIQEKIQAQPLAKGMQDARNRFTEMMKQVNAELQKVLAPEQAASSCTGNCSSCGGSCHHS